MINNGQSRLLLYCCEDVKSHRSGGDTVPLKVIQISQSKIYQVFYCCSKFQEIWFSASPLNRLVNLYFSK